MTKYDAYTLWVKYRSAGWTPYITAKGESVVSPYSFLLNYARRVYDNLPYYQRGKTWMIKPEGQMPTDALKDGG